jgi:type I site-specific restriction-modification system R (restriction) subunit
MTFVISKRRFEKAIEAALPQHNPAAAVCTTLQKFPVIAQEIGKLPGQRFGAIVDEARSSQSGESTKIMKSVLAKRPPCDHCEIPTFSILSTPML